MTSYSSLPANWSAWAGLSPGQLEQLASYEREVLRFNRAHNLVSPAAAENFRAHHLTHALSLRWRSFPSGSTVVDWGSGGGLPAIPLAIAFPAVTIHAVDSVRKKMQAVRAMARRLGLENVEAWHGRAEDWPGETHYSVSRATAPLADLWQWHSRAAVGLSVAEGDVWPPGLVCLKGGDLREEVQALKEALPRASIAARRRRG